MSRFYSPTYHPLHSDPRASAQAGFTLIELLVVVSITVLLMLTISVFFLTFVVGNTKAVFEQKIKRDGETALEQMSTMLRNARSLAPATTCTTGMTSLSLIGQDGLMTTFQADTNTNRIASISSMTDPATTFYLTSDFSALDANPNQLNFNCYLAANNQHYVEINFTLKRGTDATNNQTTLSRSFQTGVTLRN